MKILQITAGAAGMYCGSCTRDNALARALMARGHDVTLVPVYTPTRPDEPNVSRNRVLFGGISVYLQQYVPLFRATPRRLDRIWDSPSIIRAFAGRAIKTDARLLGELTISMLRGEQGVLHKEFAKLVAWAREETPPDVIDLPNSLLIAMAAPLARALSAPVCCTLQGEELFLDGLVPPYREQARALIRAQVPAIDRFIAVSDYAAGFMASYLAIPPDRISVVPLGISLNGYPDKSQIPNSKAQSPELKAQSPEPKAQSPEPKAQSPFTVGYFARIAPEKGLHVLADAYVRLRARTPEMPMRLVAAGYLPRSNQSYMDDVKTILKEAGLAQEFEYQGEVDRPGKIAFLRGLDVLSVPATYDEPKGMFLLEAMAAGVPVVQPRRGSFTEIVERTGGGVLVPPDDAAALAGVLEHLARTPAQRDELSQRAFDGMRRHYTVDQSVDRLLEAYRAAGH